MTKEGYIVSYLNKIIAGTGISKFTLTKICRVKERTMYDWMQGKRPSSKNIYRIIDVYNALDPWFDKGIGSINAMYLYRKMGHKHESLLDLLMCAELDIAEISRLTDLLHTLKEINDKRKAELKAFLKKKGVKTMTTEEQRAFLIRISTTIS